MQRRHVEEDTSPQPSAGASPTSAGVSPTSAGVSPNNTAIITLPLAPTSSRVSQRKLRGVADVVPAVIQRQRSVHLAVEALAEPTLAAVTTFISTYDTSRTQHPHAARELTELEVVAMALRCTTQVWMGPLMSAAPTINVSGFSNGVRTQKGIIADARRMIELVQTHQAQANDPLSFADVLIADLMKKLEAAEKEFGDVGELSSAQAELRSATRIAAGKLHRQLVGLRRALRPLLGRAHPDYRTLLIPDPQHAGRGDRGHHRERRHPQHRGIRRGVVNRNDSLQEPAVPQQKGAAGFPCLGPVRLQALRGMSIDDRVTLEIPSAARAGRRRDKL